MKKCRVRRRFILATCFALHVSACGKPPEATPSRAQLLDPAMCGGCHQSQYTQWLGSAHAFAADDPVFLAMNKRGQEQNPALGAFCVNCHAPMAVREGKTTDGLNLATVSQSLKGVTCYFCHTVAAVRGTHNNPLQLSGDTTMRGEYQDPVSTVAHKSQYSALHDRDQLDASGLCGSCHDIVAPSGDAIERTFAEWQTSVFSQSPGGNTCGQCHMSQSPTLEPIAQAPHVPPRRAHSHTFAAVDLAMDPSTPGLAQQRAEVQSQLNSTLQAGLCVISQGGQSAIRVILDNVAAGHGWPSGASQDRRAWVEVIATSGDQTLYQSGVVADGNSVIPDDPNSDPDLWLMRNCSFDAQGAPTKNFWQAASHESNTLPALATFDASDPRYYQTHMEQYFPRIPTARFAGVPDRVTLRVRLQPIGVDILQDLALDPNLIHAMVTLDVGSDSPLVWTQAALSSPPSFVENGLPAHCVSTAGFNLGATRTPAVNHSRCAP